MPTATYDAVIIGAGHNGLTCACYLARAGLHVAVVEANDDVGGLTVTQEITGPGYHSDLHAFGYQFASLSPAPDELDLRAHGLELLHPDVAFAHAFPDGQSVLMHADLEQTCASIARHSVRDADRWRTLFARWIDAEPGIRAAFNDTPGPLSTHLASLERAPQGMDEYRFANQSLRAWTDHEFESDRTRLFLGTFALHANVAPDEVGGGQLAWTFDSVIQRYGNRIVKGGMGNVARALARCLEAHGGVVRTGARVTGIETAGDGARAVRLDDGDVVTAERVVASSVDPRTLVVELLGTDVVGHDLVQRIEAYEWGDSIMVIYLALDRPLEFVAGADVGRACYVHCLPPSLEPVGRMFAEVRAGLLPTAPAVVVCNDGVADPSRVPEGRGLVKLLVKCVPYEIRGDAAGVIEARTWAGAKAAFADRVIALLARHYVRNLPDAITARVVHSPVDQERLISSAVRGTELQGAFVPYQQGPMRPVPELGRYRVPGTNVYLCGAASHPGPGVSFMPGRNAARVICGDLGLPFPGGG